MNRYFLLAFFLAVILLISPVVAIANPEVNTVSPPIQKPPPLETQLAATLPMWTRPGRLLLYVQRRIRRRDPATPSSAPPVDSSTIDLSTPEGVAAANDHTSAWFGSVLSIAPAEMTILNTDPALYDIPSSEIAKAEPLNFLLKSLSNQQFNLVATTGLGMTDLTPQQVPLFTAMIPNPLDLVPSDTSQEDDSFKKQIVNIPREQILQQIRLHFYIDQDIAIPAGDYGVIRFTDSFSDFTALSQFNAQRNYFSTGPMKYAGDTDSIQFVGGEEGQRLKSEVVQRVPTALKKSDFNWKDRVLNQPVSIDGIETVDDLVTCLSKALKIELYADTTYGKDKITFGGDLKTPAAVANLMQALAFSLNGAWRHVGPCYILTDDIVGLGQRQEEVRDIVSSWSNQLQTYGGSTTKKLAGFSWVSTLSPFPNDPDLLPSDQLMTILDGGAKQDASIKWSELPVSIQTKFAKQIDERNQTQPDPDDHDPTPHPKIVITPDTPVDISAQILTALELPGDGIMSFNTIDGELLPQVKDDSKITMSEKFRAVICAPKSTKEALETVDKLTKMGLNTLIIDVFCNGKTYFDNSAFPPKSKDAANVLRAAIAEAAKKNITVYAAVDLLCWRKDYAQKHKSPWAFPIPEDVDIYGRPPEADGVERMKKDALDIQFADIPGAEGIVGDETDEQINDGWVSPLDPNVRILLSSLMADLAKVQGISGIILLDTAAPGYALDDSIIDPRLSLGFSVANRLKLIRENHLDPVDLNTNAMTNIYTDDNISFESDPYIYCVIPGFQRMSDNPLRAYLDNEDTATIKECVESAAKANPSIAVLTADRTLGFMISPWQNTKSSDASASTSVNKPTYSFLSMPVLFMGSSEASLAQDVEAIESGGGWDFLDASIPSGAQPDGIAYNLVDGGVDENVPKMLDWLATYLSVKQD